MIPPPLPQKALLWQRVRSWSHMAEGAVRHRLDPEWVPSPRVAYLLLTLRCNGRCLTCNSWKHTGHDDMTADQWHAVFRQARGLDIVKLLGGEPFVREDILQILTDVREIVDPYILQVTTNGWATHTIVEAVERIGWPGLQVRVSVDGDEATHDRVRGTVGLWAAATRTLERLAELRPRLGFNLGINFAIKDESIDQAEAMLAYAERFGADLVPGVNVTPFLDGSVPPEVRSQRFVALSDPRRALPLLEHDQAGVRRQLPGLDQVFSRPLTSRVFRRQIEEGRLDFPCRALREILYVLPNGDVVRCGVDHTSVGNLKTQALDDIWSGEASRLLREKVDRCPGCLQASIHILSRFYTGRLWE